MAQAVRTVPRSRALALLAWLLCALLGPAPALPALHFALVAHRVCPEHGELEHVDTGSTALELGAGAAGAMPNTGRAISAGRAVADGHGHEPCGVAGIGSSVVLPRAEQPGIARLHGHVLRAPSGAQRAHQGIALLQYAPKLAPPAHA